LRQLTDILDRNNCSPDSFAKKKLFSRFCQQTRNPVGYTSPKSNKFKKVTEDFATNKE